MNNDGGPLGGLSDFQDVNSRRAGRANATALLRLAAATIDQRQADRKASDLTWAPVSSSTPPMRLDAPLCRLAGFGLDEARSFHRECTHWYGRRRGFGERIAAARVLCVFSALGGPGVGLSSPAALGAVRTRQSLKQHLESGCWRLQLNLPLGASADGPIFTTPNENRCVTPFNAGSDLWFALKESRPSSSTEGLSMTAIPR